MPAQPARRGPAPPGAGAGTREQLCPKCMYAPAAHPCRTRATRCRMYQKKTEKKNRGQKLAKKKQNTGAPKKADHHRAGGPHNHVPRAPPAMSPRVISINNNATLCTFCSGISLRGLGLIASKRGDHYFRVFPFAWLSSLLDARGASKAQPYQRQREMHAGTQTSDEQHYAYELLRLKNDEECRISAC